MTGCSWDVAGRLSQTSETTLRRRRDEWIAAGVFAELVEEAIDAYDRIRRYPHLCVSGVA